jgi:hypothetical protein
VHLRMLPSGMVLVLGGLQVMTECNPSIVRGLFVIARFVKLRGLTMMFGSLVIVLCCLFVMLVYLVFRHSILPDISWLPKKAHCARNSTYGQLFSELIACPAVC